MCLPSRLMLAHKELVKKKKCSSQIFSRLQTRCSIVMGYESLCTFLGCRINLASLPGSPPIFCRSTPVFCSEMTNGCFSLFGFYSRSSSSSRWLSAKSDQFRKWAAAPVNSHLNPQTKYCQQSSDPHLEEEKNLAMVSQVPQPTCSWK